jgi:hypothetical protein
VPFVPSEVSSILVSGVLKPEPVPLMVCVYVYVYVYVCVCVFVCVCVCVCVDSVQPTQLIISQITKNALNYFTKDYFI